MIKGTIYIDGNMDMERLVTLLANNGYTVQVKQEEGVDLFGIQYRVIYRRKDEYDEE